MSTLAASLLAACASREGQAPSSVGPESRLRVAEAAEAAGERDMAVSMYMDAANAAPADDATVIKAAQGLARNGSPQSAIALLARRLKAEPGNTGLLRTLGGIQVLSGDPESAEQTLSAVLARDPDDDKAMVDKAIGLDLLHRHGEAQALYRQALARTPGDAVASNDLALSLLLSGRPGEARAVLGPFADETGLPSRIRINLGIMDAADGRPSEARDLIGSHIRTRDLSALTRAAAGNRPTTRSSMIDLGPPQPRRPWQEEATPRRPLQEQLGARVVPAPGTTRLSQAEMQKADLPRRRHHRGKPHRTAATPVMAQK
jgi:Flp pilus assembly protein TadD